MKGFVSLPFSRLALTKSSVLSDATTVTFAEPMFQVSVMIGFVTASLDCLRLDFKLGENGRTPSLALSAGLNY